jgi:glycosyltransferase involved in cell wall biosynthesis
MRLASMLIHPSHREGFPNVLLQAGAMFCPIVCSNIIGNIDVVDENTGLLFEVQNYTDLGSKIDWALQNSEIMTQRTIELEKKVRTRLSKKIIQENLVTVYKKISLAHGFS